MLSYWQQDTSLKIRNAIVTFGSCGLSGYAGWLLATDLGFAIQVVSACILASVAYNLSEAVSDMARYKLARDRAGYYRNLKMAAALVVVNLLTDYSASVTLRDFSMARSGSQNTNANNAINEVKRIEDRMAQLTTDGSGNRITLRPSAAYDGLIEAKESAVRIEAAKVKCWTECQKLKDELALLVSLRATSKELEDLRVALPLAKADVKDTPVVGNAAIAPIIGLMGLVVQDPEKSSVQYGQSYLLLIITAGLTWAIWYLSSEIGTRAGPMTASQPAEKKVRPNIWIEDNREPIPLKAEDPPPSRSDEREAGMRIYKETTTIKQQEANTRNRLEEDLKAWADRFESRARQMRAA